VFGFVSELHR